MENLHGWEKPIPLKKKKKKAAYPLEVFPGWFSEMVKEVSKSVQTPCELAANIGMSVVSSCLAQRVHVTQYKTPLNIWTMTLLPAGSGKSPVSKFMRAPIKGTVLGKMALDDTTPEQTFRIMDNHTGKAVVISAEGTFFDNVLTNRKVSYGIFLKSYDEEETSHDRSGESIILEKPSLTIGICLQNKTFQRYYNDRKFQAIRDNGLFDRFLISVPDTQLGQRRFDVCQSEPNKMVIENYNVKIKKIMEQIADNDELIIPLTEDAKIKFLEFRQSIEPRFEQGSDYEHIDQWIAKMDGKVLRLAGLLAAMNAVAEGTEAFQPLINSSILKNAIDLAEYYCSEFFNLTCDLDTTCYAPAERLLKYITRFDTKDELKKRDLQHAMNGTSGLKEKVDFDKALKTLEDFGYIRIIDKKTKGPRSIIIEVNPLLKKANEKTTVRTVPTLKKKELPASA